MQVGSSVPNPLYHHIFSAYYRAGDSLRAEIDRWAPHAEPLEDAAAGQGGFGLTPLGTYRRFGEEIRQHLRAGPGSAVDSYAEVRYAGEESGIDALKLFLRNLDALPRAGLSTAEARELWVLLGSHDQLFLDTEAV